jgi:Xaa-Pro aminopeptidase
VVDFALPIPSATSVLGAFTPRNRAFRARALPLVRRNNNTGIRIEDDYLITERELEWISRAPREIAEVEGEMRHRSLQP